MTEFTGFEDEPIMERRSDIFGEVRLYAPLGDPSGWDTLPFMLETQHGEWTKDQVETRRDMGLKLLIHASAASKAFHRTSLLSRADLWQGEMAEV